MIIKYSGGETVEGFLLSQQESSMRVALQGSADAAEFLRLNGRWMSEDLEPVEIVFEWQRRPQPVPVWSDADFICPKELADHLMRLLPTDSDKEEPQQPKCIAAGRSFI
jgi:hypothetical protein